MGHRIARIALVFVTCVTALALTATAARAASSLTELVEVASANDDMGSTAIEWSGATYNPSSNVLLTVDDEENAYEFALTADGSIDDTATPRIIDLALGSNDFEGVAWIEGETYGFLSEGSGEVIVATVPEAINGRTTLGTDTIQWRFDVISGSWGNLGPEGLATDGTSFYVTREMPATISKFTFDGIFEASVDISSELADASGITVLDDGTFLVISHESRMVAHYSIDWASETATQLATRDAGTFSQLEGIASAGADHVHLFGEDNTRKGNPGQTYAHLTGELLPPPFEQVADVNCSGTVTIADAIRIAQIRTGVADPIPGCGSGDVNNDGRVSVLDAILVSECNVGVHNDACPDVL